VHATILRGVHCTVLCGQIVVAPTIWCYGVSVMRVFMYLAACLVL
jgi:hypothetical protein